MPRIFDLTLVHRVLARHLGQDRGGGNLGLALVGQNVGLAQVGLSALSLIVPVGRSNG